MQTLVETITARYPSAAQCAAALGISRQALHQARARRRLSERATIRAAALLKIDPGQALLTNATAPENIAAPESQPSPKSPTPPPRKADVDAPATYPLYYVKSKQNTTSINDEIKKTADHAGNIKINKLANTKKSANVHNITSKERSEAVDLIRWVFAVAKLPADSPRFNWYVSRWLVPEKIANAKQTGTFEDSIKCCPPINPDWINLVPAALDAYHQFTNSHFKTRRDYQSQLQTPTLSTNEVILIAS